MSPCWNTGTTSRELFRKSALFPKRAFEISTQGLKYLQHRGLLFLLPGSPRMELQLIGEIWPNRWSWHAPVSVSFRVSLSVCCRLNQLCRLNSQILLIFIFLPSWAGASQLKGLVLRWMLQFSHKLESWQNVQNIYFIKKRGCLVSGKEKTLQPQIHLHRTVRTRTKTALQLKVCGSTVASCSSHELSSPWYVWSLTWNIEGFSGTALTRCLWAAPVAGRRDFPKGGNLR